MADVKDREGRVMEERRRAMRTRKRYQSPGTLALLGAAAVLLAATGVARAQVGSDMAAGILVFPKIVVDNAGRLTGGVPVDTVVEIANTDPTEIRSLHCFWVNANSYCNGDVDIANLCDPNSDDPVLNCRETGRRCLPAWRVTDFFVAATQNQPIGFRVGQVPQSPLPCQPGAGCPQDNDGSINPVEDPFIGELKCVEVDDLTNVVPVNRNDFTGTARIYRVTPTSVDVHQYNAIGIQSIADPNAGPNDATTLCLGTDTNGASPLCSNGAEYASCPSTLVVNHFFEGAAPFGDGDSVNTTLTLVPCTENIEDTTGTVNSLTGQQVTNAQLAIVNEFEQRFSSATRVDCYKSTRLSDLDTRAGTADDGSSIFAVGVQGTLTGQTRVRGVPGLAPYHGLLGVAEESYSSGFSAAYNVNYDGIRPLGGGDVITIP